MNAAPGIDLAAIPERIQSEVQRAMAQSVEIVVAANDIPLGTKLEPDSVLVVNDESDLPTGRLQARIDVVTRTNSYQVRTGDYSDDVISVYLILRRYWGDHPKEPMEKIAMNLADRADTLCTNYIVPKILRPISNAISSRS